ncbi:MAG: MBL fold metallo-hydrolase [Epsilonproteobacteria bacterium]|nr:MBL fold metallo-hydrolase [Campylobacterota bacterium]
MKSLFLSAIVFHSLFSFTYDIKPVKVAEGIHCYFGAPEVMDRVNNGNMVNSCFVDLGSSYLVIDSGPTYLYAKQATAEMQKIKKQKVSYVINTHIHDDHWLGNGYYQESGAEIIGPKIFANTTKSKETRMQKRISKEAYAKTEEVFPSKIVEGQKQLELEGVNIIFKAYDKKAHSENDMTVFIPSKRVVFAGDLVFNERIPSLRSGDINHWIKVLESINAMDVDFVIGGHGHAVSKDSTKATLEYLTTLKALILKQMEEGADIADVVKNSDLPAFQSYKLYDMMHRQNVEAAYRMLEWAE